MTQNSALGTLNSTAAGYDAHRRQNTVTDARTGTTTFTFDDLDRVLTVTTPVPAAGESAQVTTSVYDEMGRVLRTQAPDGLWTTNEYYLTGLYRKTSGARVYPVEYTFDYAGRLGTMTTWQDYASSAGAAVTQWKYEGTRGFLTNKVYQGTNGPGYTYSKAGRLSTRTWARMVGGQPLATTYSYNNAGELAGADYSDATPDVAYAYDRQGRPTRITGATTNDFAFTAAGLLLSENVVNKTWNYASQTRLGYDALQRRTGLTNLSFGLTHTYAYDAASRLQGVSTLDSGAASQVSYSYVSNSPLVGGVTFQQGGTTRLTTSKTYDNLNRLRQINSVTNAQSVASFAYAYNAANQRTAVTNVDGSRWSFGYDQLGQVTNGWRYWSDGSDVLGQTFNYAFDDIGNRKSAGTGTPGTQRTQSYGVNLLNQYTNRTVPGYIEVNGSADSASPVTVNGGAVTRQGEYYRQEVSVNNASAGLVQWLTSRATNTTGTSIVARLSFTPQTPESYTHDADGNLTQDGLWSYTWDGENRLTRIETRTNAIIDSNYWQRLDATYDYQSRRVRKQVSAWNPGTSSYQLSTSLRFFYDGWNLVSQIDEVTGTRLSFIWGTDLSGSMQGAGGVGGLKEMIVHNGPLAGTYFYSYDGNGNVAALINAADGTEAARYEYGPFLELIRATGPLARLNPFRASTKYHDDETDLLYYGYRYLSTVTGRWVGRDPIGENGGLNVYGFLFNDSLALVDTDGRESWGMSGPGWSFQYQNGQWVYVPQLNQNAQSESTRSRRDWRERNYWRIANFSLFDERGKELLGHWLNGDVGRERLTLEGDNWRRYMVANEMLRPQIIDALKSDVNWRVGSGTVNRSFHADIENGYFTGYEMLHGTHRGVGDFHIQGTADVTAENDGNLTIRYNLSYTWNDVIDPNFSYDSDQISAWVLRRLYSPKNYTVRIRWTAPCTVKACKGEIVDGKGYPFDGGR